MKYIMIIVIATDYDQVLHREWWKKTIQKSLSTILFMVCSNICCAKDLLNKCLLRIYNYAHWMCVCARFFSHSVETIRNIHANASGNAFELYAKTTGIWWNYGKCGGILTWIDGWISRWDRHSIERHPCWSQTHSYPPPPFRPYIMSSSKRIPDV